MGYRSSAYNPPQQPGTPWLWIIAALMSAALAVLKIAGIGTISWWAVAGPLVVMAGFWVVVMCSILALALLTRMWADTSRY